ncbi:MepB family protein [Myroides sp. M-43]|uniref:MepB family protein n=1 Tax=Myroides oncorhynchi TaxID=2893756 RepID=UPI001E4589F7|nr:MepB family protein [Myroides oncorhynchi]MCC9042455.1 MepB family protein [Myroides oncorhynchi]
MFVRSLITSLNKVFCYSNDTIISSVQMMSEKNEYSACSFILGDKRIIYREAKVTSKKIGFFVAIWQRNEIGVTVPYHVGDEFDYMMIGVKTDTDLGYFLFPKVILVNLGIISTETKEGKRGMRIYPNLEEGMNKQALKTYQSQMSFFYKV